MELKKQLAIIPPMSEPLKKLNEVLDGIAVEENIEISIIDDLKELSQFLGSAGQCLITFSNAKKCATFLQENRAMIQKSHSKVILLSPKEIPAKTLIKFTKIGLTEAILETSPPKTLLYKVKLLLRSLKTSAGKQAEKDQVVKSMIDINQSTGMKGEINADREHVAVDIDYNEENSTNKKIHQEENAINYDDHIKSKAMTHEDSIETHWKSKRKTEETSLFGDEKTYKEDQEENLNEIDMYYRGKRKISSGEELEIEKAKKEQEESAQEEIEQRHLKQKHYEETTIDLDVTKKESTEADGDEERPLNYTLNPTEELSLFDKETPSSELISTEEETEEHKKRRELDELDSLFEEAKKRLEEKQLEELEDEANRSAGPINTEIEFEDEEKSDFLETEEEISPKRKSQSQDMVFAEEKDRPADQEIEEVTKERKKRANTELEIDENLAGRQGQSDVIDSLMKSEFTTDESKKIQSNDLVSKTKKQQENEEVDENNDAVKKLKNTEIDFSENDDNQNLDELEENDGDLNNQSKETTINLDDSNTNSEDIDQNDELNADEAGHSKKETNIKLSDSPKEAKKKNDDDESGEISLRKMRQTDLEFSDDNENLVGNGKVDQIDTFYRSGNRSKNDQNWDILNSKESEISLALGKKSRKDDENLSNGPRKDAGEITIDYRMLKAEFDSLARGEFVSDNEEEAQRKKVGSSTEDEEGSFKVIEVNPKGFDFGINVLNLIYQKESRPADFYKMISEEMISHYQGYPIFYSYKVSEKKHHEAFNSIMQTPQNDKHVELIEWWSAHKDKDALFEDYFLKTMTTWICRDVKSKKSNEEHWEDVELPSWAQNELGNKMVELVFPYFDGVDRMGIVLVIFPNGINPKNEKDIEITLEMARVIQLDSIQRKTKQKESDIEELENQEEEKSNKKNVLSMFSGLFKGKKTG